MGGSVRSPQRAGGAGTGLSRRVWRKPETQLKRSLRRPKGSVWYWRCFVLLAQAVWGQTGRKREFNCCYKATDVHICIWHEHTGSVVWENSSYFIARFIYGLRPLPFTFGCS